MSDFFEERPPKRRRTDDTRRTGRRESYRPSKYGNIDPSRRRQDDKDHNPHRHKRELRERDDTYQYGKGESYRPPRGEYKSKFSDGSSDRERNHHLQRSSHRNPWNNSHAPYLREDRARSRSPNRNLQPFYGKSSSKKQTPQSEISSSKHNHTSFRSKIRSLEKLLSHTNSRLPADVRRDKERELEALRIDLQAQDEKKERSSMIKRYHFIRFLERRKAEGMLKRLGRERRVMEEELEEELAEMAQGEMAEQSARILQALVEATEIAQTDLNYTVYSPLGEKYISLYPKQDPKSGSKAQKSSTDINDGDGDSEEHQPHPTSPDQLTLDLRAGILPSATGEKPPLWHTIKKYTLLGDKGIPLLEKLRDRAGTSRRKAFAEGNGDDAMRNGRKGGNMGTGEGNHIPIRAKEGAGSEGWGGQEMEIDGEKDGVIRGREDEEDDNDDEDSGSEGGFFEPA